MRWLSCMLLTGVWWANAIWGLPFLTVLCPSERYYAAKQRAHQKLTERAWQMMALLSRWLPERALVFVADSSFAVFVLLDQVSRRKNVSLITRLRMDAQLYDFAPERKAGQQGRPRIKGARRLSPAQRLKDRQTKWEKLEVENWYGGGKRQVEVYSETCLWGTTGKPYVPIRWVLVRDVRGEFEPCAFLSTELTHEPLQMLTWFVRRWRMEVTFEEARAHLGIETQRQWNDLAIARSTPLLFGLFSLVTLMANAVIKGETKVVRTTAWYEKEQPTFSDALALVRRCLWSSCHFQMSHFEDDIVKIPRSLFERLTDAVCYAARLDKVELIGPIPGTASNKAISGNAWAACNSNFSAAFCVVIVCSSTVKSWVIAVLIAWETTCGRAFSRPVARKTRRSRTIMPCRRRRALIFSLGRFCCWHRSS
ncbi:MAG: transposase [Blastocatellia bacterium]